ncbi:metallophosphoesterase [Pseudobacteroides cellulosolvens]|uniref:Calcineurin-like phosphoesterase superfamily domain containing protein n=1 Tax=Pseudobacteroides cellulosolvens ATCC 35603 = DSM 2933 TaxID=398512 RepID=A0A0L6JIT9_9FIRM|nr:metallophosphoesterase [Pseudobacteroides cellulosolvens]KNY25367.1 Calcineurin-like phosphoesterase superfamily domain containing protein [Pseudobacteroides cellulosolvens ATCC 35603 = DSM 2933]
MYEFYRLSKVYTSAQEIPFDDSSKIAIMSDCHRGDGSWGDNFLNNKNIYSAALNFYYQNNYTYIELGDGDELWENNKLQDIIHIHSDVFNKLSLFYKKGRLHFIYGNHDMAKKNDSFVKKYLYYYINELDGRFISLFKNIKIHEGIILKHKVTSDEIFLTHGHQADFLNDTLWKLSSFLVEHVWKHLELLGFKDPTSTAKNYRKQKTVGKKLIEWAIRNKKIIVTGHTHRPTFPDVGEPPYFNTGSCVHPHGITVIEITGRNIALVKWHVKTRNDGTLFVDRDIMAGPNKLRDYYH